MVRLSCVFAVLVAFSPFVRAQDEPTDVPDFDFQTGTVTIGDGLATLDLPTGYVYLQSSDARFVVEDMWGNPPDPSVLGLIAPGEDRLLGEQGSWAVIVSYDSSGFVKDDDAAGLDYDDMLAGMKKDSKAENDMRKQRGYPTVELLGWAEPPHYDAATKKLYWAKSLRFEGADAPTLNYNVRILGAGGVLVYNAVAGIDELAEVSVGCKDLLGRTTFSEGNRYADHNPSVHKVAAYGIGGLIAGKVLLKTGLIAKLIKPLLLVIVAVGAGISKLLKRNKGGGTGDPTAG